MLDTTTIDALRGRLIFALLILNSSCIVLTRAAAFPDWTDCPAVCRCKWTSGKKSAFCPDAGLTSLPASLDPDMQVLDLSGNKIPELQSEIFKRAGLVNLQKVFLRNAGIYDINSDAFKDMRILIEVDLSDNHLAKLEQNTFLGNERLRVLVLSGNPLKTLINQQFPTLQHLRTLELQRCELKEIHSLAFTRISDLETLRMDNNQLSYLEETTLSTLTKLKTLTIDGNKWSCDCRLKGFRNWLIPNNIPRKIYSVSQICSEPQRLQGRNWEDIKITEFACSPNVKLTSNKLQEDVNGNLSLSCLISGEPEPELSWQFNGIPLNLTRNEQINIIQQQQPSTIITSIVTRPIIIDNGYGNKIPERWNNITLYNVSEIDAGEYSCYAKNIGGYDKKDINIVVSRIFTAPTLSQTDNWLLWLTLAGGAGAAICAFITAVLVSICLSNGNPQTGKREKVKLKSTSSFGDQEKKLLDLSVTTTTTTTTTTTNGGGNNRSGQGSLADTSYSPGDLELAERSSICDAATVTIERLRPDCSLSSVRGINCPVGFPPPPPEFTGGVLPFGNIFISVAMPQDNGYPDLLDINVIAPPIMDKIDDCNTIIPPNSVISSYATLPRRTIKTESSSSGQYDNMGPRVTATGSSTFSLTDDLRLSPPPPPRSLIKPPIEFVSL